MLFKERRVFNQVDKKIRVLTVKVGLDGHWRGVTTVSLILKNAGMEVIFGGFQTIENAVNVAVQEDVDVIGLSIHSGAHITWIRKFVEELKKRGLEKEFVLVVGGAIPEHDFAMLKQIGAHDVFGPGTLPDKIIQSIQEKVEKKELESKSV